MIVHGIILKGQLFDLVSLARGPERTVVGLNEPGGRGIGCRLEC